MSGYTHSRLETAGTKPTAAEIKQSEIAINEADGLLYTKDKNGVVIPIGGSGGIPDGSIGRLNSPLLDLPLQNSLAMNKGVGAVTFTRASTATYIDRYGVLQTAAIDEPRFEKDGLLVEGASTNLCLHSNNLGDASWSKTNLGDGVAPIVTGNYGISPDGTQNSNRVQLQITDTTNGANSSTIEQVIGGFSSAIPDRTLSIWVKSTSTTNHSFVIRDYTTVDDIKIITSTQEWVRYELNKTGISSTSGRFMILTRGGYGTDAVVDVEIAFCQYEELPFASSYIPTTTTTVTRELDDCLVTFDNNVTNSNDSHSFSMKVKYQGGYSAVTTNDRGLAGIVGEEYRYIRLNRDGSGVYTGAGMLASFTSLKDELKYVFTADTLLNKVYSYADGEVVSSSSVYTPTITGARTLRIGGVGHHTDNPLFGWIKGFKTYDVALTPEEVALL